MKCRKWGRSSIVFLFIVIATVFSPVQTAQADSLVSVCDDAHLHTAVSGGGTITFSCSGTIVLSTSLIISASTTIDGNGQSITISGNDIVQVIVVNESETLNLNNLTIVAGNSGGLQGSAILNNGGTVNIVNSTVSDNNGDSIFNEGGLSQGAALNLVNSTIANNAGNGIYNWNAFSTATVTVTGSTFTGNSDSGILILNGKLTVTNSTFSNNSWRGIESWGTITVINSTFFGNHIGGIENAGLTTVKNILISNSRPFSDCTLGTITAASTHNLADDSTCGSSFTVSNQINLGSLANNGGPTNTMALLPGNAAIDAGDNDTCLDTNTVNNKDQRGITRITQKDPVCDIGAYEALLDRVFLPFIRR